MPIIKLQKEKCIGCGTCWSLCEQFFEADSAGKSILKGNVDEIQTEDIGCAKNAADSCPVQCIKIDN